jgi:hypothetical protein
MQPWLGQELVIVAEFRDEIQFRLDEMQRRLG